MAPEWIIKMPKVELHAHLNGSLSQNTIRILAGIRGRSDQLAAKLLKKMTLNFKFAILTVAVFFAYQKEF
jgi:adenosine deaminase